nr:MAG TPA: hypothetical protein [Caudoviricetes sp.]
MFPKSIVPHSRPLVNIYLFLDNFLLTGWH